MSGGREQLPLDLHAAMLWEIIYFRMKILAYVKIICSETETKFSFNVAMKM